MKKKLKKKIIITQKEHDEWHKKHGGYEKNSKEHDACHRKFGITVKKKRDLSIINRYRRDVKKGIKNSYVKKKASL